MNQSQLSSLLNASNQLTSHFEQLREKIRANSDVSEMYSEGNNLLCDASKFKKVMRQLAEGLQKNRQLTQLNKESVKKNQVFLEGLQQLKANMNQRIVCTQTNVAKIDKYLEFPLGQIDWVEGFESCEKILDQNLQFIKEKNKGHLKKIQEKSIFQKKIQEEKNKNQLLPKQAQKLFQDCSQIASILGIQNQESLKKIQDHNLSEVYDIFFTLRQKQNVEVTYEKEDNEFLQILIQKKPLKCYELAQSKKINIQEKPLKLVVVSLNPTYKELVIGVDRRSDFSNLEIFNRLIKNEQVKSVFRDPENEAERNFNSKYIALDSIQKVLTSKEDVVKFIDMIRLKIFSLNLNKFIFQNMKKLNFYQPLLRQGETSSNGKKPSITEFNKIAFKDYIAKVRISKIVNKFIIEYQLLKKGILQTRKGDTLNIHFNKQEIEEYLKKQCLEELIFKNSNQYYTIKMNCNNVFFSGFFIVPYDYPNNPSKVKIVQLYSKKEKQTMQFEGLRCRYNQNQQRVTYSLIISQIQKQVNEQIDSFVKEDGGPAFRLLFQVNRLCSIVSNLKGNQKSKGN